MTRSKEKWQAHMNRVGASALREETAELSQYFSQFGGVQFGGASRKDFFNKGYRTMKVVITARQEGHTVGHPMNPYHGGGWQEAAFDDGVEAAKAEFRALRLSK